jgi:hypothetical protein
VATTTPAPAGPTACTISLLPTGGITKALVTSGDPTGRYLAGRVYPSSGVHTVMWKDGTLLKGARIPGDDADINDITSAGIGVGTAFNGDKAYGYVVNGGSAKKLRGGPADARAVNEAGVIVGAVGQLYQGTPARWASAGADPVKLPMPSGQNLGSAVGVDEDGTIIGDVGTALKGMTGYLWLPDGTSRAMPLPTVDGRKATSFWPESISNGWVAGRAVFGNADASQRSFASMRFQVSTGTYEKLPTALGPDAIIAANGWIFGSGPGTPTNNPLIVSGSHVLKLPMYGKVRDYIVSSFSADGRTAAGYSTGLDNSKTDNLPFRWTCH